MSVIAGPSTGSSGPPPNRWYFGGAQLEDTPSARAGHPKEKELSYRQQAANFIQDMGQRLQVTQLCINTAIVYMHRFYMFHSFSRFHRNTLSAAALFLAAKVEEQPRKLEHVIKVAHICLHKEQPPLDSRTELYMEHTQELVSNENILLQTLGFDVAIDHPHTHVVRCCQLVKASKELAQTSYFMATNSLHLTTMCLRFPPTIVACVCIHLACKWSHYMIPVSAEGKEWFSYVDPRASFEQLEQLTDEFLTIFDKCPSRLKKKIKASSQATREEEDRRARGNITASHYQLDLSVRPASSSTAPPQPPPGAHHGKHGHHKPGHHPSSSGGAHAAKPGSHHGAPPGAHHRPQPPPQGSNSASSQPRPDKVHTNVPPGSGGQRPGHPPDSNKRPAMDPAQYEEYKRRKMMEQQQAQMAKAGMTSLDPNKQQAMMSQQQRGHHSISSSSQGGRPPQQVGAHPQPRPGSHPSTAKNPAPHHGSSKVPPPMTSSTSQSLHHRKPMPPGGGSMPQTKAPMPQSTGDHKRLSLPHNHQKPSTMSSGGSRPTSSSQQPIPIVAPQPQQQNPNRPFQQLSASKPSLPASGSTRPPPHQAAPPPPQQQQQQPKKSIFDIDLSDSPIRDPGLNTLLEPITSPANLSDVSDLEMREQAADVSLEPGEILDTPGVNSTLSDLGFPFPGLLPQSSAVPKTLITESSSKNTMSSTTKVDALPPPPTLKTEDSKSLFRSMSRDNTEMVTKSLIKTESSSVFGLPNIKKNSPSPAKTSKRPSQHSSLFSPDDGRSGSGSGSEGPALKLPKLEETPGYEKLRDGRQSIKVAKDANAPKEMLVSIPWNGETSSLVKDSASPTSEQREHKEKKKKKKEKKEKKDKDRKKDKKDKEKGGSGSERKHKKHKDKDRERSSSSKHTSSAQSSPMVSEGGGIRIKIKGIGGPPSATSSGATTPIAPLKINLGMPDPGQKKRSRPPSDSEAGPASKMSRAMGTSVILEDMYFSDTLKRSTKH